MQIFMKSSPATKAFRAVPANHLLALPWWNERLNPDTSGPQVACAPHESFQREPQAVSCEACGQALTKSTALQGIEVLSLRAGWRRRQLLRWDEIQALSCDVKYINITDNDGIEHVIEDSLDRLCALTGAPFVRIHRSHAIHPAALNSVVTREDGTCDFVLKSGLKLPGSRRQSKTARLTIFGVTPRRRRGE